MIYREVPSSSILPLSSIETSYSMAQIEKLFSDYFFQKGQNYYSEYKSSAIQANSTFLKDLFTNISKTIKDKNVSEQQRLFINLSTNTIINQLTLIEELFSEIDRETLNAVICGCLIKHLKKYFS